jgi:carnitine O-palmitoyltransferase 1
VSLPQFALTYEASVTRLFNMGRTETVRSLTCESRAFVEKMLDAKASVKDKVAAIQAAEKKHTSLYKHAMTGGGVDRHLFGLYVTSVGLGYDSDFLKSALKMPWTLSTSQTPQKQTNRWNPEGDDRIYVSPGGGFGPVADDGYGVSYMFPNDDCIFFHVSSKKSSSATDTSRFMRNIEASLADVKQVLEAHMAEQAKNKAKK